MKKQEPAYPSKHYNVNGHLDNQYRGMSKRFYAACAAMQGILANEELRIKILSDERNGHPNMIGYAYEYADELLKQEYDENN